jgi:hypothetical protein
LFYLAVVLEKRDILRGGFDPQDVAKLVVHFEGDHLGVPHPRALEAHVIAVAHLALVVAVQLLAQKRGDVVGLDRVNGGPNQIPVDGLQVGLPMKHDVGGVFGLIQTPVVRFLDPFQNRAVSVGELISSLRCRRDGSQASAISCATFQSAMLLNASSSSL